MKSWVLFKPEQIVSTADRNASSEISTFQSWVSTVQNPGSYEVKFYLTDAAFAADGPDVFVVNATWAIDLDTNTGDDKPFAAGSGFGLLKSEPATVTDTICADQGPFFLVHLSKDASRSVVVRVAVRKIGAA